MRSLFVRFCLALLWGAASLRAAEMVDAVHRQPNTPPEMWKSDSIQLGVMVPGQPSQWEFGFARGDDGKALVHTWLVP